MFWAVLFISIGMILLLQTIFKIELPIFRILFGIFLIYIGVKFIFGSFGHRVSYFKVDKISTDTQSIFSQNELKAKKADGQINRKYSTVFGSSTLDLRGLTAEELAQEIKVENAFGKTEVLTDATTPIKAQVESGFASVIIRGQKVANFGDSDFQSPDYSSDKPALKLKIEAAFGEVVVE